MILFVCTGNTCRSPLAAALARAQGVDAGSAGLAAFPGDPATPQAIRAAERHGADLTAHRAQRVNSELVNRAETIYVMTPGHRDALNARFPEAAGRVRVLSPAVPDPYGGGDAVYEACVQRLMEAMKRAGILQGVFPEKCFQIQKENGNIRRI